MLSASTGAPYDSFVIVCEFLGTHIAHAVLLRIWPWTIRWTLLTEKSGPCMITSTNASPVSGKASLIPHRVTCPTVTQRHAINLYTYAVRLHALEMNVCTCDTLHTQNKLVYIAFLRHSNMLQIGLPFLNCVHGDMTRLWCPLLAAWRHNHFAGAHFVAKSTIRFHVTHTVPFLLVFKCPCTLCTVYLLTYLLHGAESFLRS